GGAHGQDAVTDGKAASLEHTGAASGGRGVGESFWTRDRAAQALASCSVGALPRGTQTFAGVSTDTRGIGRGDLFVALAGERFDAHEFLRDAVARGAAGVVVSRPQAAAGVGVPVYTVRDTLVALGALANYRRRAWGPRGPVVAIAGSNGKTTTKELTRSALASRLEVHATAGNLNNLIGVPLTLLALPDTADVAVVELGMNVPGEMARLNAVTAPTITVITCIAEEHLEGLGSIEGVMREESMAMDGADIAVVPASQPEIAVAARGRVKRVVTVGLEDGDLRATRWGTTPDGHGWLEFDGVTVRPPVPGAHNLRNAMLAVAVARECGISTADAARGIEAAVIPPMRMAWESLGTATLINDAYNASPGSMRAALDLLNGLAADRQRAAVLGTMRELGSHSARLHDELARYALGTSIETIAAIGDMAVAFRAAAPNDPRLVLADDVDALWPLLEPRLTRDAIVLLKASRGVRLERFVPILTAWATR
ncbi:MAG: UDP-N-acetylmuramoyl-tripeptide--D-alanyl-D-alanine ligase, partial [Gemmatimonadaceae bacterium]